MYGGFALLPHSLLIYYGRSNFSQIFLADLKCGFAEVKENPSAGFKPTISGVDQAALYPTELRGHLGAGRGN